MGLMDDRLPLGGGLTIDRACVEGLMAGLSVGLVVLQLAVTKGVATVVLAATTALVCATYFVLVRVKKNDGVGERIITKGDQVLVAVSLVHGGGLFGGRMDIAGVGWAQKPVRGVTFPWWKAKRIARALGAKASKVGE